MSAQCGYERHHGPVRYRRNAPGVLLARGPLDYDVPVTVRCPACASRFVATLATRAACPHCAQEVAA